MTHAAAPDQFEDRLVWAFLHTFLRYGLLHSAVDGPEGQWFVQIAPAERIHHLTDTEDAFDFVLDILEIIHDARDGGQ
ncbi:hypothetical protein OIE62_07270 [Streptomyces scopuliridis]|uniref:Uncharacterized protein n=1 Tax=Streptomyces scopuliridis TaxID=452529 RepID=A0ACD4ZTX8_9ACTN|nr:hypothetical protein [Streptomyces scopuliridis]WSC01626.1 hypothetical protein OG835_34550 [Streptomyces scopuliridis]WSC04835.1 hypothetical protein OIE62_07270 [Streptomyces scopuliridis]